MKVRDIKKEMEGFCDNRCLNINQFDFDDKKPLFSMSLQYVPKIIGEGGRAYIGTAEAWELIKRDNHTNWSWITGVVLLNIATLVWMYTMRKGIESATAITFYALFTVAGCSFLGFVIFKEPLSLLNSIGLVLGFIALIMISIE